MPFQTPFRLAGIALLFIAGLLLFHGSLPSAGAQPKKKKNPPAGKQKTPPANPLLPKADDPAAKKVERTPKQHWIIVTLINSQPADKRAKYLGILDLTDQMELARIAIEGKDQHARFVAVHNMTGQPMLAKVAGQADVEQIRKIARDAITGEHRQSLERLSRETKYDDSRKFAEAKLKERDEKDTAQAAHEAKKPPVPVVDRDKFAAFAKKAEYDRLQAIEKSKDAAFLLEVALKDPIPTVGRSAVLRLQSGEIDASALRGTHYEQIAVSAKTADARAQATKMVLNQKVLAKISDDPEPSVRLQTISMLSDVATLKKLTNDADPKVRAEAATRYRNAGGK
jgi:hypothetical protein